MTIASSKLYPYHGMNATMTFCPRANSPWFVAGPSAMMSPAFTFWFTDTNGRWLIAVSWLVLQNLRSL